MAGIIPLIGSGVSGPLGALHLPRLWLKVTLSAKGQLAADYDECGMGFDQMTLDGLGLNRDDALAYLKGSNPSYPEFEAWVKSNGSTGADAISAHNAAISGYNHDDETRSAILGAAGIADDGSILDAVSLNNLDDWTEFH